MNYYLGCDIGSVSAKMVVIGDDINLIASIYLKNKNIIQTIKECLTKIQRQLPKEVKIKGVGCTGSGREFTKLLLGADIIKTEILSHTIATLHYYPRVNTIFDIGGEDCKIITLENGIWKNYIMNNICLIGNTDITTKNYNSKPIKEIKEGEKVLTHKGRFKRVTKTFIRDYNGKIINISTSNLRKLEVTPGHPILALKRKEITCYNQKTRNNMAICKPEKINSTWCKLHRCKKGGGMSFEPRFIKAKELKKGDFIVIPLPKKENNISHFNFSKIKPIKQRQILEEVKRFYFKPDLLRLLGYYLAEGSLIYCLSRGKTKKKCLVGVNFTFNINEKDYVNDILNILRNNFRTSITTTNKPKNKTTTLSVYNKSLAQTIEYLCNSKAHKKQMSKELMFLNPLLQLELLKGLFRGDGCFINKISNGRTNHSYCLKTISKQLAYQVQWILLRNQIKCGFFKENKKTKGGYTVYNIKVCGLEINKLKDTLFHINEDELIKIHSYSFIHSNLLFIPIKQISKHNYNGKVYNLQVKDDDSYTANSLSVHNCGAGTGAMIESIARTLNIKIEDVGDIALTSKINLNFPGKCGVLCQSAVVSRKNKGAKNEDILMGMCRALVNNYLTMAKSINLKPPYVFQGATAKNKALIKSLKEQLNSEVTVPKHCDLMGAIGIAILTKEHKTDKTTFRGFELKDIPITSETFICKECPNKCEITKVSKDNEIIGHLGSRCGRWK